MRRTVVRPAIGRGEIVSASVSARVNRFLRRIGLPGVAGLGVLAACAAFWGSALAPLEERAAGARARLARFDAGPGAAQRAAARTPESGLAEFYRFFAMERDATAWLERLHALARAESLELPQGAYRYNQVSDERLARYEINLPVRGTYPQIRRFIAAVLNEVPVLSLDQIAFEKKRVGDGEVEAQLRLTLYLAPRAQGKG